MLIMHPTAKKKEKKKKCKFPIIMFLYSKTTLKLALLILPEDNVPLRFLYYL